MANRELAHRVAPGKTMRLAEHDTADTAGWTKEKAQARMDELGTEMAALQELLYGAAQHSLLIVLQGMDTSGKDGAISHVMAPINPQGCAVTSFKQPTATDLAHDFLWRIHPYAPARGMIGIFNRSHYEDVLVARVHDLVPKAVWKGRYGHINAWEALIADADTLILKFFLHISKGEQEERLLAREKDPDKAWKLDVLDWQERAHWDAYQEAYADALTRCTTAYAPWYIVPADKKWFRNLAITETIVAVLRPHAADWRAALVARGVVERGKLDAMRAGAAPAR